MVEFSVRGWSCWSPGVQDRSEWIDWARESGDSLDPEVHRGEGTPDPNVTRLGPRQRRRLTLLTEMGLYVAFGVCDQLGRDPSTLPSVFASRHGEVDTTIDLLHSIGRDELLSPMRFSNSVHNTSAGYFSINAGNECPSHSVSSGLETFFQGLLDAVALGEGAQGDRVLYVFSDILLAEPFDHWEVDPAVEFGVGLVLDCSEADASTRVDFSSRESETAPEPRPGLRFVQQALSGASSYKISTPRHDWQVHHDEFPDVP